jgi:hypothetical protein
MIIRVVADFMASIVEEKPRSSYFTAHQHRTNHVLPRTRKGKPNRIGSGIRQAIEKVFGALGDWEGMMAWAKDNPDLFYASVVPKLLPHELAESGLAGNITVVINRYPNQDKQKPVVVIESNGDDGSQPVESIDGQTPNRGVGLERRVSHGDDKEKNT